MVDRAQTEPDTAQRDGSRRDGSQPDGSQLGAGEAARDGVAARDGAQGEAQARPRGSRAVVERLRDDLIFGTWPPGARLKPPSLRERYETTSSALREALIRLAGEGLVEVEEQRGFSTIRPTPETFHEVRHLRLLLECEGARLAIRNGDLEWEADLNAAHHRLAHIEQRMRGSDDIREHIQMWSRHDQAFHVALMAACGSHLLMREHARVYERFRMHVVAELHSWGFRGALNVEEHGAILSAALDRDADACCTALDAHLAIYRSRDDTPGDPFTTPAPPLRA